ncbi:MAG: universal stress protein [Lentisphaeria bacterium]|jgi:nucleotide-binding universal stress UspA family protein
MDGSRLLSKLLLVVDGSAESVAAAHYAVRLATEVGGTLEAVYVIDTATMDYLMQMRIFVAEERQEFERDLELTGRRYLELVQTLAKKQGLEVHLHLLRGGFQQGVLCLARAMGADAIILGGWSGSLTRKDVAGMERQLVLANAASPVIVVRQRPG